MRREFNFSGALCVVVIVHAAMLWAWPADAPVVQVTTQVAKQEVTQVAIVRETKPQRPVTPTAVTIPSTQATLLFDPNPPALRAQSDVSADTPHPPARVESQIAKPTALIQIPSAARLHYTLTKGGSNADAVLTWKTHLDTRGQLSSYELTLEASRGFVTLLKQTSVGVITEHGLAPKRYGDKRLAKSEQATHFDAAQSKVTFSNNRPEAAWMLGSQDRLSMLLQLAALVKGRSDKGRSEQGRLDQGEIIQLPVASLDELEIWQWEVQALTPDDPAGTIKLLRRPRRAFDATIELWLGESADYLPVRIRQTDSSGVTDQVLVRSEQL